MALQTQKRIVIRYYCYTPEQARWHEVKPGITGWAQVNGRNAINWEEKFALDVWYVDNCSLWLDVKILFVTVAKALKREGISADGEVTMPEFMGSGINESVTAFADSLRQAAATTDGLKGIRD